MSEPKKCSNPACSCTIPTNETNCSPHCESLGESMEITCGCGHAHCAGAARDTAFASETAVITVVEA
jgi:hypothetical protein